jgi:hypothetical protein
LKEHDRSLTTLKNNYAEKLTCFTGKKTPMLSGTPYKDTTDECNIILNDGLLLNEVRLLDVTDSTFTVTKSSVDRVFPLGKLRRVTFVNHGFWTGFAVGAIASVAFWGVVGLAGDNNDGHPDFGRGFGFLIGLILAVPTGLVTGIIGEFVVTNDDYDFTNINPEASSKRLRAIMLKHK